MVVFQRQDAGESPDSLMDRAWLMARTLGDPRSALQAAGGPEAARVSRLWAAWAHLGCTYDTDTMLVIRRADGSAHAPRTP